MSHGLGVTTAFRDAPDAVLVFFALVTQLGDVWFYLLVLTLAYAYAGTLPRVGTAVRRERVAFVVAVALGALALTVGLKEVFLHPRPPGAKAAQDLAWLPAVLEPAWENIATADGFSLPSGHATGGAATYGAAALGLEIGRRRRRYVAAALLVGLVAASRVVIGVHYLGDAVLGVAVGGGYLAVVWALTGGDRVKRAFSLALLVALGGAALTHSVDTLSALGGALGGRLGWTLVGGRLPDPSRRQGTVAALVGLLGGGGLFAAGAALDTAVAGFLTTGLSVVVVLAAPLVADRIVG
jgi:membrane-associated phospholipid phosphatase